jgi:hypothetical protein
MPARQYGKITKIFVEDHVAVLQTPIPGDEDDELDAPLPAFGDVADEETVLVDEFLLGYDRGNGVPPDLPPMEASGDPLILDIDDGRPSRPQVGALKRVDTSTRSFSKFNRFTGKWE